VAGETRLLTSKAGRLTELPHPGWHHVGCGWRDDPTLLSRDMDSSMNSWENHSSQWGEDAPCGPGRGGPWRRPALDLGAYSDGRIVQQLEALDQARALLWRVARKLRRAGDDRTQHCWLSRRIFVASWRLPMACGANVDLAASASNSATGALEHDERLQLVWVGRQLRDPPPAAVAERAHAAWRWTRQPLEPAHAESWQQSERYRRLRLSWRNWAAQSLGAWAEPG